MTTMETNTYKDLTHEQEEKNFEYSRKFLPVKLLLIKAGPLLPLGDRVGGQNIGLFKLSHWLGLGSGTLVFLASKSFFSPISPRFWVSVTKRSHVAATGTTSASLRASQLRGWGWYANIAVTKSSGYMNSTQMCTYPCGKVRRKRPVRLIEAHSLQYTHMSKQAAFGLDPGHTDKGTLWELPITQTSRKSQPQTVQWLVGEDTARKGG